MDISDLKQNLLNNQVQPCYIFTGPELALQDIYIDKIAEVSGLEKVYIDELQNIYNKLGAKTLIKIKPKLYIIRDDDLYRKSEKVWESIITGTKQKDNIIIIRYSNLDKRGKFVKAHENVLIDFDFISPSILRNRVQALTKWPIQYCEDLVTICGCNYGRIEKELYKLQMIANIKKCDLNIAYVEARKSNFIHQEIGDVIFDFTNAIVERNIEKSYKYLKLVSQTEDGPLRLLTVLYNSFRNVLLVQSTRMKERTEEILGLSKGQIYMTSQKCDRYTLQELVFIIKLIEKCEVGLKTGLVDVNYVMEYLLGEIF